jgi:hypothetical protein
MLFLHGLLFYFYFQLYPLLLLGFNFLLLHFMLIFVFLFIILLRASATELLYCILVFLMIFILDFVMVVGLLVIQSYFGQLDLFTHSFLNLVEIMFWWVVVAWVVDVGLVVVGMIFCYFWELKEVVIFFFFPA